MVKDQIRHFIAENFVLDGKIGKIADDDSLLDMGIIDSTGVLELVMFVEQAFGIEVADEDVVPDNFDSVNALAAYVSMKSAVASARA